MDDLISIIIPIYNVEPYLCECVDSVLQQTYSTLEIILVNDGSPDRCGEICDAYAKKDHRIIVIHKENGGLSDARNAGIDASHGTYLAFIDSDDCIAPHYIEKLYNLCKEHDATVAQCNFSRFQNKIASTIQENVCISEYSNLEMLKNLYNDFYGQTVVVWTKLYKRSLFDNIRFPLGRIHEDEATTYLILYHSTRTVITSEILYFYRMTENSITNSAFTEKKIDYIKAIKERLQFYKQHHMEEFYYHDLSKCITWCKKNIKNITTPATKKELRQLCKHSMCQLMHSNAGLKLKIRMLLQYVAPRLYSILYDLYVKLHFHPRYTEENFYE